MKIHILRGACFLGLLCLGMSWSNPSDPVDTATIGADRKKVAFEGYQDGKFTFSNDKGNTIKEQYMRVNKLEVKKPYRVSFLLTGAKSPTAGLFKGLEKSKFVFELADKSVTNISPMKVRSIEVEFDGGEGGGMMGGGGGDAGGTIAALDTNAVWEALDGKEPTAAQAAAMEKYVAALDEFNAYVEANSKLKAEMDKAAGPKRVALLDELKKRRFAEQPLKNSLIKAHNDVLSVFPVEVKGAPPPAPDQPDRGNKALKALNKLL